MPPKQQNKPEFNNLYYMPNPSFVSTTRVGLRGDVMIEFLVNPPNPHGAKARILPEARKIAWAPAVRDVKRCASHGSSKMRNKPHESVPKSK